MKELVELMAKALVDRPDDVSVVEEEGDRAAVLTLRVAPEDIGKVIGRQGRTARSLRAIVAAAGSKRRRRVVLEISE